MRKYLIVFILLFILMGVFSMDILGRSMKDIQDRMIGQVRYRMNVVKGVVESENINKTYNCYIAGETVVYPNIPTFSRNPKLQPGDPVTIEFINGCRETPAILAPEDIRERPDTTLPVATIIAYLHYSGTDHYLTILDLDGNVTTTGVHSAVAYSWNNDPVAVDNDGNIYIAGRWADKIKKTDNEGNLIVELAHNNPFQIAINSDGDIWTYGWPSNNNLTKINLETLAITHTFVIGYDDFAGMAFDSDGFLYMINWVSDRIEKWNLTTETMVASRALPIGDLADRAIYSSLAVIGTTIYLTQWANDEGDIFTCPTDLSADFTANDVNVDFPLATDYVNFITASEGTYIIVEGYVSGVKTIVKYDTTFTRIWKTTLPTVSYPGSGLGISTYPF